MKSVLFLLAFGISNVAMADIVCKMQTSLGPAQVQISGQSIVVSGAALKAPRVFANYHGVYDGHMTSLLTAPGVSVSYDNTYGCIRRARITTDFRESAEAGVGSIQSVEAVNCTGGSTPDHICYPKNR